MTPNSDTLLTSWSGTWIPTHSGKVVELLQPTTDMIEIHDIAHSLSHLPRYTGHATGPMGAYSVAQHSCLVHDILPQAKKLAGLMHDAHEYALSDLSRPLKNAIAALDPGFILAWQALTARFDRVIGEKIGLPLNWQHDEEVHRADNTILHTEAVSFPNLRVELWSKLNKLPPPLGIRIAPWSSARARVEFLTRFKALASDK